MPWKAIFHGDANATVMVRIDSADIFEEACRYKRWLLFYDYSWAPSDANGSAFMFWIHRKQQYLDKRLIPLRVFNSTENDCPELDSWIVNQIEKDEINYVGSGWGAILLCRERVIETSVPMLIETGINELNKLIDETYREP